MQCRPRVELHPASGKIGKFVRPLTSSPNSKDAPVQTDPCLMSCPPRQRERESFEFESGLDKNAALPRRPTDRAIRKLGEMSFLCPRSTHVPNSALPLSTLASFSGKRRRPSAEEKRGECGFRGWISQRRSNYCHRPTDRDRRLEPSHRRFEVGMMTRRGGGAACSAWHPILSCPYSKLAPPKYATWGGREGGSRQGVCTFCALNLKLHELREGES